MGHIARPLSAVAFIITLFINSHFIEGKGETLKFTVAQVHILSPG